jgi:hypothetical protein
MAAPGKVGESSINVVISTVPLVIRNQMYVAQFLRKLYYNLLFFSCRKYIYKSMHLFASDTWLIKILVN